MAPATPKPRDNSAAEAEPHGSVKPAEASGDPAQASIVDRKRPIISSTTSFAAGFGRPSPTNKEPKESSSPSTSAGNTHEHSSSTSSIQTRKLSGESSKKGVRDIVSWIEHKADKPAPADQPGTRPSLSIAQRKASFGATISSQESIKKEQTRQTPPVPQISTTSPPTRNPDIVTTSVPGSEEDDLTFREYQHFFSQPGSSKPVEKKKPLCHHISKKKSYAAISPMSTLHEMPGQESPESVRRVGQDHAAKEQETQVSKGSFLPFR